MIESPWRTLAAIMADPEALSPPTAVVPRFAWRGRVSLLAAREKSGKSTLVTAAAASVTTGSTFLDGASGEGAVLWVGIEEHPHDLAQRALRFGADPERFVVLGLVDDPLDVLRRAVGVVKPALVVVDTLSVWADRWIEDARSATSWTPVMAGLAALARESDAGVMLLHHARKSDGAYRDSTAIGAGVDVILEMSPHLEDPNVRNVKTRGRFAVSAFSVRLAGDGYELADGTLSLDARVLLAIERTPGMSNAQVRRVVGGRSADVDTALRGLLDRGAVRDDGLNGRHSYVGADPTLPTATPWDGGPDDLPSPETPHGTGAGRVRDGTPSQVQTVGSGNGTTLDGRGKETATVCADCGASCEPAGPYSAPRCNACALAAGRKGGA